LRVKDKPDEIEKRKLMREDLMKRSRGGKTADFDACGEYSHSTAPSR
jgi:hypothetical protein